MRFDWLMASAADEQEAPLRSIIVDCCGFFARDNEHRLAQERNVRSGTIWADENGRPRAGLWQTVARLGDADGRHNRPDPSSSSR